MNFVFLLFVICGQWMFRDNGCVGNSVFPTMFWGR